MDETRVSFSSNGSGVTLRTKFGDVHFSTEEYTYYESLFKIADVQNDGFLSPTTSNVVTLLLRTDIPWKDVLQAIKLVLDVLPSNSATPLSSSPNNPSMILSSSSSLSSSSTQSSASRGVLANGSVDVSTMGTHQTAPIRFAHWLLLCKLLAIFKQQQQLQPTTAHVALPQPPSEIFVAKASKKGRKGQQQTPTPPATSSSTTASSELLLQQCLTLMTNGSELSTAELRFKLSRNVYSFADGQCHKNYTPEISYWKVYGDDSFTHQHVKYGVVSHISLVNTTSIAVSFTTGPFTPPPAPPSPKATQTAVSVLVERRYSEFEQLAQTLRKQFPQYVIPPLPKKESPLYSMFVGPSLFASFSTPSSTSAQSNPMAPATTTANGNGSSALTAGLAAPVASSLPDHVARRRQVALQLFLQAVCAHPVLRHAFAVGVFLEASTNGLRAFVDLSQHIVEGKLVFNSKNGRSSGGKDVGASADRDVAEKSDDERGQNQVLQMLSNSASLVSTWSQQAIQSDVVQQWWGSVSKSLTSLLPAGGAAGGSEVFGAHGGVHPHYVPVEQLTQSGLRALEGIEQASKSMERWHSSESVLADERGKICEGIKQVSTAPRIGLSYMKVITSHRSYGAVVVVVQMSDSVWSPEVAKVLSIFHHGLDRHTEFHRALQEAIYYTVLVPLLYLGQYREVLQSQNVAYYSQLTEKYVQASKQAERAQQQLHQARQIPFDTSSTGNGANELHMQQAQQAVLEKERAVDKLSRDVHKAQVTLQSECARLKLEQRRKAVVRGVAVTVFCSVSPF